MPQKHQRPWGSGRNVLLGHGGHHAWALRLPLLGGLALKYLGGLHPGGKTTGSNWLLVVNIAKTNKQKQPNKQTKTQNLGCWLLI